MGIYHTDYVAYGIRTSGCDYELQGQVRSDGVVVLLLGAYDKDETFLVINESLKTISPGEPVYVGPYSADDHLDWDGKLVQAATDLNVKILSQSAWIFAPDDS